MDEMLALSLGTHRMGKYGVRASVITLIPVKFTGGYEFLVQNCTYFPLFVLELTNASW